MTAAHRVIMNTVILYVRMAITVILSLYTTLGVYQTAGSPLEVKKRLRKSGKSNYKIEKLNITRTFLQLF